MRFIASLMIAVVPIAVGGRPELRPAKSEATRMKEKWKAKLENIERQLQAQDYASASTSCSYLARELLDNIGSGGSSGRALGIICAYRAIAETGLGNGDKGLWYWRTAQVLFPGIEDIDLHSYEPISEQLKAARFRQSFPEDTLNDNWTAGANENPPEARHKPKPRYPHGMITVGVEATYKIEVVIDVDGQVKEPKLITKVAEPALVYAILTAVGEWKYRPALLGGKPVPVLGTVIVDFNLRR